MGPARALAAAALLGLAAEAEGEDLRGLRRLNDESTEFSLTRDHDRRTYHYVGSASFNFIIAGFVIRCYDIAMYLNRDSHLWTRGRKQSRAKQLQDMVDNVQFEVVAYSRWVNKESMAQFVDRLEFFAEKANLKNYSDEIKAYKQVYLDGPQVTSGSRVVLIPSKHGMTPIIAGQNMGLVKSDLLGLLVTQAYLGPDTDLPEFRESVFQQLAAGFPKEVGTPAESNFRVMDIYRLVRDLDIAFSVPGGRQELGRPYSGAPRFSRFLLLLWLPLVALPLAGVRRRPRRRGGRRCGACRPRPAAM